ncbi:MAG TPA: DUF3048 domain-containing protein [Patescibacteria group bacterium]|nr:DUF3048 domain-containing protein [Patescibacteria group bacterium]
MEKRKLLIILLTLGVYLLTTGLSYSLFTRQSSQEEDSKKTATNAQNDYEALEFDPNAKKTEECPLNGAKYSKEQRKWWEDHRPMGIMIENHPEARPQSGLSFADVVYEAVAEGGITRFMGVFYCQDAGIVGPVRSARTYYLDFISEYGIYPLYVHWGGANCDREGGGGCANGAKADALGHIVKYGWFHYNAMDGMKNIPFPAVKDRPLRTGQQVATEHQKYGTTSLLWKEAAKRGLTEKDKDGDLWDDTFVPYSFKDDADESLRPVKQDIHIEFWESQPGFNVDWKYDPTTNTYLRNVKGGAHKDRNNGRQISVKNVIVLYMEESNANDGYPGNLHLLYGTKGKGDALFFTDGKEMKGTWRKDGREERTQLFDENNKEIEFNRGATWFTIVPLEGVVDVN